jgi:hypothetical protein
MGEKVNSQTNSLSDQLFLGVQKWKVMGDFPFLNLPGRGQTVVFPRYGPDFPLLLRLISRSE